jgi:hypothetical protein
MADDNTPAGAGAPAAPVTPPAAAPAAPEDKSYPWLPDRLAQSHRQGEKSGEERALATLGLTGADLGKAKAILDEAAKSAEANKSAEQRAADLAARLTTTQTEADRQAAIIKEHAARMLGVLEADHQKAVRDIAGDDPAKQLQTIHALTPIWAKQAPAPAVPVVVPPATTAPPPTAPGGAPGTSPPDHVATYGQLKTSNPFAAAAYGARNPSVYDQPKS